MRAAALTGKTIPAEVRAKMSASQRRRRALEASEAREGLPELRAIDR